MLSLTVNYFVIACDRSARVLCYKICSPRGLCLVVKGYLKTERHMTTYKASQRKLGDNKRFLKLILFVIFLGLRQITS